MNERAQAALLATLSHLIRRHGLTVVVTHACDIAQARAAARLDAITPTESNRKLALAIMRRRNQERNEQ